MRSAIAVTHRTLLESTIAQSLLSKQPTQRKNSACTCHSISFKYQCSEVSSVWKLVGLFGRISHWQHVLFLEACWCRKCFVFQARCRNATSVWELTGMLLWGLQAGHTFNHEKTAYEPREHGPPETAPTSPCCHSDIKQLRLGRQFHGYFLMKPNDWKSWKMEIFVLENGNSKGMKWQQAVESTET